MHCTALRQAGSLRQAKRSFAHVSIMQKVAPRKSPSCVVLQWLRHFTLDSKRLRCLWSVSRCHTSSVHFCRGLDQHCTAFWHFFVPRQSQTDEHRCAIFLSSVQCNRFATSLSAKTSSTLLPHFSAMQSAWFVAPGAGLGLATEWPRPSRSTGRGSPDTLKGANAASALLCLGLGHFLPAQPMKSAILRSVSMFTAGSAHWLAPWPRHSRLLRQMPDFEKRQL
mmetsp:Transcript_53996/g.173141  ORF Transcript_53996/g.173141 Transcript_53996/m.173141 type:complete len:223 (+) Transcript_53996:401-1069(+)